MNQILSIVNDPGAAVLYQYCEDNRHKLIFASSPGQHEESAVIWLNDRQLADLRLRISGSIVEIAAGRISA